MREILKENGVRIAVEIDDAGLREAMAKYREVTLPDDYDTAMVYDELTSLLDEATDGFGSLLGRLFDRVREDVVQNYSEKEYEVEVDTQELVNRRYIVSVTAANAEEASELAKQKVEGGGNTRPDDEDVEAYRKVETSAVYEV